MRPRALAGASLIALALLAAPLTARAQEVALPPDESTQDFVAVGPPLDAAEKETLSRALNFDPAALSAGPVRPWRAPGLPQPKGLDISGKENPAGSGTVTLTRPLPSAWDAKVGGGLTVGAPPPVVYQPGGPMPSSRNLGNANGAAWASLGIDNIASVDARMDGGSDQSQIGTTLERSLPFGSRLSVTLRDRYAMSDSFGDASAASVGLPVMSLPQALAGPRQVYSNEKDLKFNILPTGTTLSAGLVSASNDTVTHRMLSADQQLYGPLHVTTSVTDIGQPTSNKSVLGALKFNW